MDRDGVMREVSVWSYPWDLHDLSLDRALGDLGAQGVNTVSLATSYHAGRFLQPGNPRRRVWFPQDGTVYYTVDTSRWVGAEIVPLQADIVASEGDYLAELIARRDAGGPAVSCWTVCFHNTRLGMLHPGHVMRTAHGDPHYYGLCPSSPAARAYVTGLVAEISHRYRPDRIELESPDFMGFAHGYHHEKDGLGLLPEETFLLGVCFCDHCVARATAASVPAEAARRTVAGMLDEAFRRELPEPQVAGFPAEGIEAFRDWPEVHAYLEWRREPVTSLLAEIRAAAHSETRILLIDFEGSWWGGVHIPDAAAACDGILHCAYFTALDRLGPLMAETKALLRPGQTLIAGFQLFYPEVRDAEDLARRTAAVALHVDGVNYYNLGLVPPQRLDWIGRALSAARA
jgi:hypothetical protein